MKAIRACLIALCISCGAPAFADPVVIGTFSWDPSGLDDVPELFTATNDLEPADAALLPPGWFPSVRALLRPLEEVDAQFQDYLELVDHDTDGTTDGVALFALFDFDLDVQLVPGEVATSFADFYSAFVTSATLDFGDFVGFSISHPLVAPSDVAEISFDAPAAPVPEPGTILLLGCGLAFTGLRRRP